MNPESLPTVNRGDPVRAEHHNSLVKAIRRRTPTSSTTIKVVETSSGFYCDLVRNAGGSGGAGGCQYSWTPNKVRTIEGFDVVVLNAGSVSGATVNVNGTNILSNPELQIPNNNPLTTHIVYLSIPVTKIKTADNFVYGCTITGGVATVEVATSLPTSTQSTRYHELFRWKNGRLFNQVGKYNVAVFCRDDGTSTDVGVFTILTAG